MSLSHVRAIGAAVGWPGMAARPPSRLRLQRRAPIPYRKSLFLHPLHIECEGTAGGLERASRKAWRQGAPVASRRSARRSTSWVRWRTSPNRPCPYRTRAWFLGLHVCGLRLPVQYMPRLQLHEPAPALMFTNFCATDPSLLPRIRCFSDGLGESTRSSSTKLNGCASIPALKPPTPSPLPVSGPCSD